MYKDLECITCGHGLLSFSSIFFSIKINQKKQNIEKNKTNWISKTLKKGNIQPVEWLFSMEKSPEALYI